MAVTVRIPTTLRPLSGGASTVEVAAGSLADVISALDAAHPGFHDRLLDDDGNLRRSSTCSSTTTTCATSTA